MYKLFKGMWYYMVVDANFMAYDNGRWKNLEAIGGWRSWLAADVLTGIEEVNELELLVATGTSKDDLANIAAHLKRKRRINV